MPSLNTQQKPVLYLKRIAIIFAVIWTTIVIIGVGWHFFEGYHNALESASIQAAHSFEKDLLYRRWVAGYGGLYVPVTSQTRMDSS